MPCAKLARTGAWPACFRIFDLDEPPLDRSLTGLSAAASFKSGFSEVSGKTMPSEYKPSDYHAPLLLSFLPSISIAPDLVVMRWRTYEGLLAQRVPDDVAEECLNDENDEDD